MAHTPGPWTVTCDRDDDDERPLEIVTSDDWNHRIAFPASNGNPDDARLIAAAPDLLAALKGLLPEGWGDDDTMDHIPGVKQARAAIAKAEAA
jgi:hypothetical protein